MQATTRALHCMTGVSLGIGLLVVLNELQIPFYLYYPQTTSAVLISNSIDLYLFLATSICVPATFAVSSRKVSKSGLIGLLVIWATALTLTLLGEPYGAPTLYVTVVFAAVLNLSKLELPESADLLIYALIIGVLVELAAVFYWGNAALYPLTKVGLPSELLEADLTFSLYPIALLMMLILMFSWLWTPLLHVVQPARVHLGEENQGPRWNLRLIAASLDLLAILAIIVFFYPYLAGQTWVVGVDSYLKYLGPLTNLTNFTPSQAVATSYTHGLYLILLYVVELASGASPFTIVKFAPLVLAFVTASLTFLAMQRAGWSVGLSILSAACTLLWLPTTLGIFAGIQANWFAYLLWMLFLSFYFVNQKWNPLTFIVEATSSLVMLLIHPWTWGVFVSSLLLTALISIRTSWRKKCIQGLLAALVLALPVGGIVYQLLPGMRSDLVNTLVVYQMSLQQISFSTFEGAFEEMFFNWGSFLSPILLAVCLIGAYALVRREGVSKNYLVGWIATWCFGSILIAPYGYSATNIALSETQLWRMLYLSPLPFLLALGIERCGDIFRRCGQNLVAPHAPLRLLLTLCALLIAASGGFSILEDALLRLVILLATMATITLMMVRYPHHRLEIARVLLVSVLLLLVVNATFRSLFPLLLNPHNLHNATSR